MLECFSQCPATYTQKKRAGPSPDTSSVRRGSASGLGAAIIEAPFAALGRIRGSYRAAAISIQMLLSL